MSKTVFKSLKNGHFWPKKLVFWKKNPIKSKLIDRPGDLKLGFKKLKSILLSIKNIFWFFFQKLWCKGPQILIKGLKSCSKTQRAVTHGPEKTRDLKSVLN